jgi:hypothetical protein
MFNTSFMPSAHLLEVNFGWMHPMDMISILPSGESNNKDDSGGWQGGPAT